MRRASIMSVIAPAGSVKRNIGSVGATWTAENIMGSGLRLVMSQFDEVSNIANPTFDAELAISMTVNAKLPKTPQSRTAAASDLAVDSLDNKIPIGRARNWVAATAQYSDQMANNAESFKAPQCEKRPQRTGALLKKWAPAISRESGLDRRLNRICPKQFHALAFPGCWSRRSAPP